jgi:hypothetical protein
LAGLGVGSALPHELSGADDGVDTGKICEIRSGVGVENGEVGQFAGRYDSLAFGDAHASCRVSGEHGEDGFEVEAAFAQLNELSLGGVVGLRRAPAKATTKRITISEKTRKAHRRIVTPPAQ